MSNIDDQELYGQDEREFTVFLLDDDIVDTYAPLIGAAALAIYVVLVRFAKKGQRCPSQHQLGKMLGIQDVKTVRKHLDTLTEHKLIDVLPRFINNQQTTSEYRIRKLATGGKNPLPSREIIPTESSTTTAVTQNGDELPRSEVWQAYEENIGPLTPMIVEELDDLEETHNTAFVIAAIKEAVRFGKRRIATVSKICQDAAAEGRNPGEWTKPEPTAESADDYWAAQGVQVRR